MPKKLLLCVALTATVAGRAFCQAPFLIPISGSTDYEYDSTRQLLWITTDQGQLQRYSMQSHQFLAAINAGANLSSLDLSPDSATIAIADRVGGVTQQASIKFFDISAGTIRSIPFSPATQYEFGPYSVVMTSNTTGFFSTDYGYSGSTPLREFNTTNVTTTIRSDARTGDPTTNWVRYQSQVMRTPDRSKVSIYEWGVSSSPFDRYTTATNSFSSSIVGQGVGTAPGSLNRDGTLVGEAPYFYSMTTGQLVAHLSFAHSYSGSVFDPIRDILYVEDVTTNQVVAFNTSTWLQTQSWNVSEVLGYPNLFQTGANVMAMSGDGQYLFFTTTSGIRVLNVPGSGGCSSASDWYRNVRTCAAEEDRFTNVTRGPTHEPFGSRGNWGRLCVCASIKRHGRRNRTEQNTGARPTNRQRRQLMGSACFPAGT